MTTVDQQTEKFEIETIMYDYEFMGKKYQIRNIKASKSDIEMDITRSQHDVIARKLETAVNVTSVGTKMEVTLRKSVTGRVIMAVHSLNHEHNWEQYNVSYLIGKRGKLGV